MMTNDAVKNSETQNAKVKFSTKELVLTAMMAAMMCVLGPLSIPLAFTPVPVAPVMVIIYLSAYVLDWKYSTWSVIIYLLLGTIGLPVFSSYGSGIAKVMGPTGGYLLGYVLIAVICGWLNKKFQGNIIVYVLGMCIGLFFAYLFGTLWFMYQQQMGLWESLGLCVVPFLIGDAVKIIVAAVVGPALKGALNRIH